MASIRTGWNIALLGALLSVSPGCSGGDGPAAPPQRLPIASELLTTRQRVVLPDPSPWATPSIQPSDLASYQAAGYGTWRYGPGVDAGRRLELMPSGYTGAQVTATARLATFFTFSDTHLTDEESPAGAVNFGYLVGGNSSAYSGVMLYTTQVLDAAVQTVNAIQRERPIDFGLHLGDTIDNTQANELSWYLEVMDGRVVSPDSGVKDDPIPGPGNDHQDPFQAAGFDPPIPWWQVRGNHDDLWKGSTPVTDKIRAAYVSGQIMNVGPKTATSDGIENTGFYVGVMDGRSPYGAVFGAGPEADFAGPPTNGPPTIPADPDRHTQTRPEWMSAFLGSTSIPAGHGFTAAAIAADTASYAFQPMGALPLKVIVLDDTQTASDFDTNDQGSLGPDRLAWLLGELQAGQDAGQLMIIAAHIPLTYVNVHRGPPYLSAAELAAQLNAFPNLVLWVSGHVHRNNVFAWPSLDPARPPSAGYGFWEVWTGSLRDLPQMFRLTELALNSDASLSIFVTAVAPAVADGSLVALSRDYSVGAYQLFAEQIDPGTGGAYNAELMKPLSPALGAALQGLGTGIPR